MTATAGRTTVREVLRGPVALAGLAVIVFGAGVLVWAARSSAPDACSLLTRADVNSAIRGSWADGQAQRGYPGPGATGGATRVPQSSECDMVDRSDGRVVRLRYVTQDAFANARAGGDENSTFVGPPPAGPDPGGFAAGQPPVARVNLAGIGDEAFVWPDTYNPTATVWFRRGDRFFAITYPTGAPGTPNADGARLLTSAALARVAT